MSAFHRLTTFSILILLIAFLPAASYAITVKGEVMHAADWTMVTPCAISMCDFYYEDLDFPVDPSMSGHSGDRLYIQVYRDGEPLEMIDYLDDGLPDGEEASIEFIAIGPSNDERESSKVRIYISSSIIHSPDSGDNTYTIDYYWNGQVLYEELSTSSSNVLYYPCNEQSTTNSCDGASDITVYEDNGTIITECATSGAGCVYSFSQVDNGNWFQVTLSGTTTGYHYYTSYEFNGFVEMEDLGETESAAWNDLYPRFPITHVGWQSSDDLLLKVYYDNTTTPLTRCVVHGNAFGSVTGAETVGDNNNHACLTTQRVEYIDGQTKKHSGAVLSNVGSGKGKDQLLRDANGNPQIDGRGWFIDAHGTGADIYVTYYSDMSTNALPFALGRSDDDSAILNQDLYKVIFPNLDCEDYLYETYGSETCVDALEGSNECDNYGDDDDDAPDKCIELELDPADWQLSTGSRYYQQIEDNSIYYSGSSTINNQIIDAVFATRNGVKMVEKALITQFTSPYETVFACINSCGIPQDEWRVYVNNGLGDPEDGFPPTLHAFNPWTLYATDEYAPHWLEDDPNDMDIPGDIFTVLNNIGFKSTSVGLGGAPIMSGSHSEVRNDREDTEENLFGTHATELRGVIGAYEKQDSIGLYLQATPFAHWSKTRLFSNYNLDPDDVDQREAFWEDSNDEVWDGSSSGSDDNGILDYIGWMTDLVIGNTQVTHFTHSDALLGLEFDFEPVYPYGDDPDSSNIGHLFFEPFYPYDSDLLDAIEERGLQIRKAISAKYQYLTILCYFNSQMFINPGVQAFIRGLTMSVDPVTDEDIPIHGGIHIFTSSSYRVPLVNAYGDSFSRAIWEENMYLIGKGTQKVILLNDVIDDTDSDWDETGGIEWGSTLITFWDIHLDAVVAGDDDDDDDDTSEEYEMDWNLIGSDQPNYGKQNWMAKTYLNNESKFTEEYLTTQMLPYCDQHLVFPLMNFDLLWLYPKGLADENIRGDDQSECNANGIWADCDGDIWHWNMDTLDQDDFYQTLQWKGTSTCPCYDFNAGTDSKWETQTKLGSAQIGLRGRWGADCNNYTVEHNSCNTQDEMDDFYCGGEGYWPPCTGYACYNNQMMYTNDVDMISEIHDWAEDTY